jgi:DNA replication protein DnaC
MVNDETQRKLRQMKLTSMANALEAQESNAEYRSMSFDDRFKLLVDAAYASLQSNKLNRLIKSANFRTNEPCIADINYLPDRKLDRNLIQRLATGTYIQERHNVIMMGASGNGKTWLATALGIEACHQFHKVKYVRLPELIDDLIVAKHEANGDFHKIIERYKKVELLIIDEWLLTPINDEQAQTILELIEYRSQRGSTIFCTQFAPEGWHSKLGNPQIADAILDRIVHDLYKLLIQGDKSMRERYGIGGEFA